MRVPALVVGACACDTINSPPSIFRCGARLQQHRRPVTMQFRLFILFYKRAALVAVVAVACMALLCFFFPPIFRKEEKEKVAVC